MNPSVTFAFDLLQLVLQIIRLFLINDVFLLQHLDLFGHLGDQLPNLETPIGRESQMLLGNQEGCNQENCRASGGSSKLWSGPQSPGLPLHPSVGRNCFNSLI